MDTGIYLLAESYVQVRAVASCRNSNIIISFEQLKKLRTDVRIISHSYFAFKLDWIISSLMELKFRLFRKITTSDKFNGNSGFSVQRSIEQFLKAHSSLIHH